MYSSIDRCFFMGSSCNRWKDRHSCRTTREKAPGQELTDGIYLVLASTVDTVGAFNI
nr:hypothetical protein [uncultured bacterium]